MDYEKQLIGMKKTKVLLVSHVYSTKSGDVYGPVDVINKYLLNSNKYNPELIKFKLNSKIPLPIKSIFEMGVIIARAFILRPKIFIGIDPLNALSGLILRRLGLVKKIVFYSVDYTPTRFKNRFMNFIYLWTDKIVAENCDEVWNVSRRIIDLRIKQGIQNKKIKYVPNSPKFLDCPRVPDNKINKNQIAMVTGQTHSPVIDLVLKAFATASNKIPDLKLKIIGTEKIRSQKNVEFLGQLANEDLLKVVSASYLALAIYTFSKDYSWISYGDSKKAREYLACGVPVIITDVVSTSDDVKKYNAGIVIKAEINELTNAIQELILDRKYWKTCRKNAIKLAQDFDIDSILDNTFS